MHSLERTGAIRSVSNADGTLTRGREIVGIVGKSWATKKHGISRVKLWFCPRTHDCPQKSRSFSLVGLVRDSTKNTRQSWAIVGNLPIFTSASAGGSRQRLRSRRLLDVIDEPPKGHRSPRRLRICDVRHDQPRGCQITHGQVYGRLAQSWSVPGRDRMSTTYGDGFSD
jgi:hypothetical protein